MLDENLLSKAIAEAIANTVFYMDRIELTENQVKEILNLILIKDSYVSQIFPYDPEEFLLYEEPEEWETLMADLCILVSWYIEEKSVSELIKMFNPYFVG